MKIISHRGECKYAPENTLSAFYLAKLINADGIECDVRKTKDNQLVLLHDESIDRTSNEKGKLKDYTYDQLLEFDFGNEKNKGEKIVKLEELLKQFSQSNIEIYIEIKESGYEEELLNVLYNYNLDNVILISFKYDILEKIRSKNNYIKLCWLIYNIDSEKLKKAKNINLNQILCLAANLTIQDLKKCKNDNIDVVAWGVKNKAEIMRLEKIGVDAIICDSAYDCKKILNYE